MVKLEICEISRSAVDTNICWSSVKRKRLHSRVSRGGIINTSVGSIFLPLSTMRAPVVGTFFPLAPRLSRTRWQPTTCRLQTWRRIERRFINERCTWTRLLRKWILHAACVITFLKLVWRVRVASLHECVENNYVFARCVWRTPFFIDPKSNARDACIRTFCIKLIMSKC